MVVDGVDNEVKKSALELIGNTPIVALDRLHPGPGRVLAKCEYMNPGASIKDRSALYMINKARQIGDLKPGEPVIELTSGNQGCGLAVVCAILNHPVTLTMPKGNSLQRVLHMEALGAKCVRIPQVDGKYGSVTTKDLEAAKNATVKMVEETGAYFVQQGVNEANVEAHYETTGREIWRQTGHHVDAFVAAAGTAGTFTGVSKYLKERNQNVKCFVVEPEGSQPIKGEAVRKPQHLLQGASYGFIPDLFKYEYLDGTFSVTDGEATEYTQLIGQKEGLFVGYTSGANVAAAVKLLGSGKVPADSWVVTVLPDSGLKYTPVPESMQ